MTIMTIFYIWLGTLLPTPHQQTFQQCLQNYGPCQLIGPKEDA